MTDRLLLLPHGFQGLVTVDEDANVADLAVDQVVHVGERRRCHAKAADSARTASAQERDHPLAIDLFHAVKLDPKIGCVLRCMFQADDRLELQNLGPRGKLDQRYAISKDVVDPANLGRIRRYGKLESSKR